MNQEAYDAIKEAWEMVKWVRSIFPSTNNPEGSVTEYESPPWYKEKDIGGKVMFFKPITGQLRNKIGKFVNESFVIYMWSVIEEYDVVPYGKESDLTKKGGDLVQLTKWLRHKFGHSLKFDADKRHHEATRKRFEELFDELAETTSGFPTSIDTVLPKLKNGVLAYIQEAT